MRNNIRISLDNILGSISPDSRLAKRCSDQPSYRRLLAHRIELLSQYYDSQSSEAYECFCRHLRYLKDNPDQYVCYDAELHFAALLLGKNIPHCFQCASDNRTPDIRITLSGVPFACEVVSLEEDEIFSALMVLRERIAAIPSGKILSLSIPALDQPGRFESNLELIARIETILTEALSRKDYSEIKDGSFSVKFQVMSNSTHTELLFVRTSAEKTAWIENKLTNIINKKCTQLESKENTILVLWNYDPRTIGFEEVIPTILSKPNIPRIIGIWLVDWCWGSTFFSNPNVSDKSDIVKFTEGIISK